MAVKIDLKKNSRISYDKDGYRAERIALVSGISGNPDEVLYKVLQDSKLPQYGDPHPVIPGIQLQSITADPMSGARFRVVMSYYTDTSQGVDEDSPVVRVTGSTSAEQETADIKGDRLITRWSDFGNNTAYFTADVERPRVTFDFTYITRRYPRNLIDRYHGKVNSKTWNNYPKKTVLCSNVTIDQQGSDYRVRASFSLNEETWDFIAAVRVVDGIAFKPHPTQPDPLFNLDNGTRKFEVYKTVDFSPLKFKL